MFNIIKSNKLEYLFQGFARVIENCDKDPFVLEWICVQSRGMKQWISLEIAKKFGICANISYFFPKDIIEKIFISLNCMDDLKISLNKDILLWKIMGLLPELIKLPEFQGIKNYIKDDNTGIRLFQVSEKIAQIFDNYQVYRPKMILKWQENNENYGIKESSDLWQPILWKKIVDHNVYNHIALGTKYFFENIKKKQLIKSLSKKLPQRISFFGISFLPPVFLKVLEQTSNYIEINFFLFSPCNQFWGYITSEKQREKISLKKAEINISQEDFYLEQGNPLLASMGMSGKNFHLLVENIDCYEPFSDLWQDPIFESKTMLSYIQSDILNLVHRKKNKDKVPVKIPDNDRSIFIHCCYSPMREVQVLKDQLLNLFQENPDLKPDDIIVMVPDINCYNSYIETVFSIEEKIPFTINDRTKKSDSETFVTFLQILRASKTRLNLNEVINILSRKSVGLKFNILDHNLKFIHKISQKAGICWGIDSNHRKFHGFPEFHENTWEFGLQRLMLGYAMPEKHDSLFWGILPLESYEGNEIQILGRFALFYNTLCECLKNLAGSRTRHKTFDHWVEVFKEILFSMIDNNKDNKEDYKYILDTLEDIKTKADNAMYFNEISFETALAFLEQRIEITESYSTFFTGGVIFCNLVPMRSVPFKVVALMGMDDLSFPRKNISESFDLIKKYPKTGDRIIKYEEKYLFLEALLCARQNFLITYTGMNIKDNSIIPCSSVINELIETINDSFIFSEKYNVVINHPLQPYNDKYFMEKSRPQFFSFSKHYKKIAQIIRKKNYKKHIKKDFILNPLNNLSKEEYFITIDDLISFFRMPVEYMMKNRLGIIFPKYHDYSNDREPIEIHGLENYFLGQSLLEKMLKKKSENIKDFYIYFKALGMLPHGKKGEIEFKETAENVKFLYNKAVSHISGDIKKIPLNIKINNTYITGNIGNISKHSRHKVIFAKPSFKIILKAWINHVFLNAVTNDRKYSTFLTLRSLRDKANKGAETIYFKPIKHECKSILSDIIDLFWRGMNRPLIFFPETSWSFANNLVKIDDYSLDKNNIYKAAKVSSKKWYDSYNQTGESLNKYVALCFKNKDFLNDILYFNKSEFVDNSIKISKPVIENIEQV
ncbi:MAG: exodeoxyribonuclease V subunit gamma [Desulfobacteraceae bacterium 4572_130]|nr:MAG: exodeoxyribonuclease V subunit gamma [Desulfobacteraceae bacterium 4572_130]